MGSRGGEQGFHLKGVGEGSTGERHGREWDGMGWGGGGREVAFEQPD
jgi:hypothetical protein